MTPDQLAQLTLAAAQEQARAARSQTAAAWVQAVGAIGAIATSIILAVQSARREAETRLDARRRAEAADRRAEERAVAADAAAERRAHEADEAAARRIREADAAASAREAAARSAEMDRIVSAIADLTSRWISDLRRQISEFDDLVKQGVGSRMRVNAYMMVETHDSLLELRPAAATHPALPSALGHLIRTLRPCEQPLMSGPEAAAGFARSQLANVEAALAAVTALRGKPPDYEEAASA